MHLSVFGILIRLFIGGGLLSLVSWMGLLLRRAKRATPAAQWTSGRRNLLTLGALMCFLAVCGAVFLIWGLVGAVHRA